MRPTIADLTDSFASALTPVPPERRGVCEICHGGVDDIYARCWSCEQTISSVSDPVELVVPISLCERAGQLHYILRNYKDSPRPQVRHQFTRLIGALLARFLDQHGDCLKRVSGSSWDWITTVPSTHSRPGRRPLENAISMVSELAQAHKRTLTASTGRPERLYPAADSFDVIADVGDTTLLLVDDTFTTGTNIQAAATGLQRAGATVAAAVVIGRFINPDYNAPVQALWDSVRNLPFDFNTCCLCYR